MRAFLTADDAMGDGTDITSVSDTIHAVALTASVPRQVPVPAGARIVLTNATGVFWMRCGGAASLPSGDVLDGSAPELNPAGRIVAGVATLGLVAPADCMVSLAFYG